MLSVVKTRELLSHEKRGNFGTLYGRSVGKDFAARSKSGIGPVWERWED